MVHRNTNDIISVRLPEDLREKVEEKAKESRVSRNDMIRMIIQDFFRKGGGLIL